MHGSTLKGKYGRPLRLGKKDAKGGTQHGCGATQSASRLSKKSELLFPKTADGGISSRTFEDRSYKFSPPKHFDVCAAVALKDAMGAKRIRAEHLVLKSRLN